MMSLTLRGIIGTAVCAVLLAAQHAGFLPASEALTFALTAALIAAVGTAGHGYQRRSDPKRRRGTVPSTRTEERKARRGEVVLRDKEPRP